MPVLEGQRKRNVLGVSAAETALVAAMTEIEIEIEIDETEIVIVTVTEIVIVTVTVTVTVEDAVAATATEGTPAVTETAEADDKRN
jgi:hypothetical protein